MSYERSAAVYDAIYEQMKDYEQEAGRVHELAERYKQSPGNTLLDVACGTGLHDQYLTKWYDVEGVDLSPAQLAIARKRLPKKVKLSKADMTDFDMGKRYDVVTCLFSSIGHLTTLRQMRRGVAEMAKHLKPGGVLLIEPWITPDQWMPGHVSADLVDRPDLKLARISTTKRKGRITKLEMHHVIGRPGQAIQHFVEHHDAALYTVEEYMDALRRAGLTAWHNKQGLMGRGLFIGRAPK